MVNNTSVMLIKDIANILKIRPERLNADSQIGSVSEWDSFAHVEIMMYLEENYDLSIDEKTIEKLTNIKSILKELGIHSN